MDFAGAREPDHVFVIDAGTDASRNPGPGRIVLALTSGYHAHTEPAALPGSVRRVH